MKNAALLKEEAYALIEEGQFDDAKKAIEAALSVAPEDISIPELYDYWYDVNEQLSREEKLLGRLQISDKMLELQPGNSRNTDKKGDFLLSLERYEEALNTYEKAFEIEGNITEYRFEHYIRFLKMAKCQLHLEKYAKALESCDKIAPSFKYAPNKPFLQIKALIKLNRPEEALQRLKIFLIGKSSAVKASVAKDPYFMALREHEEFIALTAVADNDRRAEKQ